MSNCNLDKSFVFALLPGFNELSLEGDGISSRALP